MTQPIISVTVHVEDNDKAYRDLLHTLEGDVSHVDVGIHPISGEELVMIAGVHEFGATIQHPGGQPFYPSAKKPKGPHTELDDGTFIGFKKKGKPGPVTKPHEIIIPARSFIRSTVDERRKTYEQAGGEQWNKILEGKKTILRALVFMGNLIEKDIKAKIVSLRDPPNAPSTVTRKGSDNPLIGETGNLLNSIRYAVKTSKGNVVDNDFTR